MLNSCSEKSEFTLDQIKKLTMKEVLCSHVVIFHLL